MLYAVWTAIGFAGIAAGIGFYRYRARPDRTRQMKYSRRKLLNSREQALYWRLVKVLPGHVILVQVPMTRCVAASGPDYDIVAREKIDFVVCDESMRIVAAIEMEDETQPAGEYRKTARRIKGEALGAVGIRLIRCNEHSLLSEAYIEMEFNQHTTLRTHLAA